MESTADNFDDIDMNQVLGSSTLNLREVKPYA